RGWCVTSGPLRWASVPLTPKARILLPQVAESTRGLVLIFSDRDLRRLRRRGAGEAAEDGARHEAGAAGVAEIEEATHQFAGGKQAWDRLALGVDDVRRGVDAQAAEGEGDAAAHLIGLEGRGIDEVRPVRF